MNGQIQRKNAYQILSTDKIYKGPEKALFPLFNYVDAAPVHLSTGGQRAEAFFSQPRPPPHGRVNRATEAPISDLMTSGSRLKFPCGGSSILITPDKLSDEEEE